MLERNTQQDTEVFDKTRFLTAAATLTVYDQCVRATANPSTGAYAITLPPVAQAVGRHVAVQALDADATNAITVQDQDDSEEWTDVTLNGGGEGVLLFSDSRRWWVCTTDTTGTGAPTTVAPTTTATTS